jgi:VanZ family protein
LERGGKRKSRHGKFVVSSQFASATSSNAAQNETVKNPVIKGLFCAKCIAVWQIQLHSDCPTAPNPILFGVPNVRTFFKYWLPVLIWMGLIFSASGDSHSYERSSRLIEPLLRWLFPHMLEVQIQAIHYLLRKCAHLTEYAVLAMLLWRGVHKPSKDNLREWSWHEVRLVLLTVMLYAATDEFHQRFVLTRTSLVLDVFIDTAGAAAGLLALWIPDLWRIRGWHLS